MSPERKKIPTSPDIRVALSGLVESAPPESPAEGRKPLEKFPTSGAVPIAQGEVVKLPFSLGSVIAGKYEIIGLIGAGGVGYVVSAMHLELGEMVALKFLREESLVHEQVVDRFAREARAAAKIKSEYVARVFDVGSLPNGTPFIVMEYLHGKDLADIVRERGCIPIKDAVEYVLQACEALASAHAVGIVHRDIKPENLFLSRQGEGVEVIKVLDFGISKVALTGNPVGLEGASRKFAKTMVPMGTPAYMSPEQIRSTGDVDARTDVWALGCVLFELLTGKCAFDAATLMQLGAAILERPPLALRQLVKDAPAELEAVILRCLEKDVSKRYQSVAELAVALYPFAPRRARISVERSAHLLRSTNPSGMHLELKSAPPPGMQNQSLVVPSPLSTLPALPTPAPAAEVSSAELAALRPQRRGLFIALALAALAVGVGVFYATKSSAPALPTVAASPAPLQKSEAAPAALPQTAAPPAATGNATETPSAAKSSNNVSAGGARPIQAGNSANSARAARPKPPARSAKPGRPGVRGDDEEDIGY